MDAYRQCKPVESKLIEPIWETKSEKFGASDLLSDVLKKFFDTPPKWILNLTKSCPKTKGKDIKNRYHEWLQCQALEDELPHLLPFELSMIHDGSFKTSKGYEDLQNASHDKDKIYIE